VSGAAKTTIARAKGGADVAEGGGGSARCRDSGVACFGCRSSSTMCHQRACLVVLDWLSIVGFVGDGGGLVFFLISSVRLLCSEKEKETRPGYYSRTRLVS